MKKCSFSWKLVLLLVVGLLVSVSAFSAGKSKYNPFTKTYKNARLEQVINDLQSKTGYKIQYDEADLDLNMRVTGQFKKQSARAVLRKVLDKDMQVAAKRGVITISKKAAPPQEMKVMATTPSRIEEDSLKTVTIYEDTTFTVKCKTVTVEKPAQEPEQPEFTPKGHYLQGYAGIGYAQISGMIGNARYYLHIILQFFAHLFSLP